jgi:tetratricopeptide (TPR) repeat protein
MNIGKAIDLVYKNYQEGNLQQAEDISRKILEKKPDNADMLHMLGVICYQLGNHDSGIQYIKKALLIDPDFTEAYNNLGNIYQEMKQLDEAIACYRKALKLNPNLPKAYYNLGIALQDSKQPDEAILYYRKAVVLGMHTPGLYSNLGLALQEQGQADEAISSYQKALQLDPKFVEAHYNLGNAFQEKGQLDKAISCYQKVIQLDSDYTDARYNLSLVLLLTGDFKQGWEEYEWRWKLKDKEQNHYSQPLWKGNDIAGCTILLHAEQGFGDTIQFIRYAPLVAERCKRVIVQCQKELISLLHTVKGVDQVFMQGQQLPEFDLHCPLLNLPSIFETDMSNIPAKIPYITADAAKAEMWKERIQKGGARIRTGLVWSGNPKHKKDHKRSCRLEIFSPLAEAGKITFYSLQKGSAAAEAKNPHHDLQLIDYTEEMYNFADTAGLIANLDLVISVDTSVAHLAGALGKNVWILLPFDSDWRWLLDREDSPWYPTMKLYRQPAPGDWESVISRVKEDLRKLNDTVCTSVVLPD